MTDAALTEGRDASKLFLRLLENPDTSYLQIHNPVRGCYSGRVERVSARLEPWGSNPYIWRARQDCCGGAARLALRAVASLQRARLRLGSNLEVQIPRRARQIRKNPASGVFSYLARPTGFEPSENLRQ